MTQPTRCAPPQALACLIIDDPLLRPRYGFLHYETLLKAMREHNFFTEIAFIPCNFGRSDQRTVRLFTENKDFFGICAHGCNHTTREFAGTDYAHLERLSRSAMWYMEQHKALTGLAYDPVMVFPQGRFSSVAMRALKSAGFVAAVNSTLDSTDGYSVDTTEYQRPATIVYHGLPLFYRRYPKKRKELAEDFHRGRPLLLVEHHTAFRGGYTSVTDLVDWINGLGNVRWTSLYNIVQEYARNELSTALPEAGAAAVPKWAAWAWMRRILCEVRDNHIETKRFYWRLYDFVRRLRCGPDAST